MRTKLREARHHKNWTLEQAAEYIGCSRNSLQRWETGEYIPSGFHRENICKIYGMSARELGLFEDENQQDLQKASMDIVPKLYTTHTTSLLPEPPEVIETMQSRRKLLQETLHSACIAFVLSPYDDIDKIFQHPSRIDDQLVQRLSTITRQYWSLFVQHGIDIMSALSDHFGIITQIMRTSYNQSTYNQIAIAASETALLLGKNLCRIGERKLGRDYYAFSAKTAGDAKYYDLMAAGIGQMALALIYENNAQQSVAMLSELKRHHSAIQDQRIVSWLYAIEAEAYAHAIDIDSCQRALDKSRQLSTDHPLVENHYPTEFDTSLQYGYTGACYTHLHKPEEALPALQQALITLPSSCVQRRTYLLADLSTTYAQLGDPSKACEVAHTTLTLLIETKTTMWTRLQALRNHLAPWEGSEEIKSLDDHMHQTITHFKNPLPAL